MGLIRAVSFGMGPPLEAEHAILRPEAPVQGAHQIRIVLLLAPIGLLACTVPSEDFIRRAPRSTGPPLDVDTGLRLPTAPNDSPGGDSYDICDAVYRKLAPEEQGQ